MILIPDTAEIKPEHKGFIQKIIHKIEKTFFKPQDGNKENSQNTFLKKQLKL